MLPGLFKIFLPPSGDTGDYTFFTDRWVKIWFSVQPDIFMSSDQFENVRQFLENNPKKRLTLFYSSEIITPKARRDLREFLHSLPENSQRNFVAIDIDTPTFQSELANDQEKALYQILRQELKHLNQGGSVAAASDILRLLSPSWLRGIYIDFSDVKLRFSEENVVVKNGFPVLIPKNSNVSCNDVIIPSIDLQADEDVFHALIDIIIRNYRAPRNSIDPFIFIKNKLDHTFEKTIYDFFEPRSTSIEMSLQQIFKFREWLTQEIDNPSVKTELKTIYIQLYKNTVIEITGSRVMEALRSELGSYLDVEKLNMLIESQLNSFQGNARSWIPGVEREEAAEPKPGIVR